VSRFRKGLVVACAAIALGALASGCGSHSGALPTPVNPADSGAQNNPLTALALQPQAVTAPTHVTNYTFWQQSGIATQVPASWAAQWATYAEIGSSAYSAQFHAAGGKYTVAYTSPNYYYTSPTYHDPGTYTESAFGHNASGARISRPQGTGLEYYLVPTSAASQAAFAGNAKTLQSGGGRDFIYADGVSDTLSTSIYRFSAAPVEITTDAQYVAGMKKLLTGSPLPTIINGFMNGNPVKEEEYVGASNVVGIFGESCFTGHTNLSTGQHWTDMANGLIYTTTHHVVAICGGRGDFADNRAQRMYWLGSWWLTYDPTYSVALEIMGSSGSVYLFAEQTLVPTNPLTTATSSITQLQTATGAYAREFGLCYLKGVAFDNCATVVNPTTSSVSMPTLHHVYKWSLVLDNNNLYNGGTLTLAKGIPTSLPSGSAVVIFI
jgi:hypothetical protein